MGSLSKSLLLFTMNWLDAQLTLLWIHLNVATEANSLMARVLSYGPGPFLAVKLLVGFFASYVLYRCAHLPIAKYGMTLVLCVYFGLMMLHAATGCAALGWQGPMMVVSYLGRLPHAVFGLFLT